MRFSVVSTAAVLAFASSALGQFFDSITSPTRDQVLPAGEPFDIIWVPEGVTGTIKITLLQGATNITLVPGPVIKTGINNLDGKLSWTPTDNGFDTYGFFLEHEQNSTLTQFSQPFHIKGSGSSSSAGPGSTTTIKLSTGPSYTSTSTSSAPSSTVTVVSTSTSSNSTLPTPYPSSNVTLSTTLTSALTSARNTPTKTSAAPGTTSTTSTNAGVANYANGGLAILGGLILAFAL